MQWLFLWKGEEDMQKKLLIFITSFVLLLGLISFVVYAAFSYDNKFSTSLTTHKIENATLSLVNETAEQVELVFDKPGSSKTYKYSLENKDSKNFRYIFKVKNNGSTEDLETLSKMIYVYQDSVYAGLLYDILYEDPTQTLPCEDFIFAGETRTSSITFELHNAAYGSNKSFSASLKVYCALQTTNAQKYIYVSNNDEFVKAVDDVNLSSGDKTIVCTSDFAISSATTIAKNCVIDLCGYTVTLGADVKIESYVEIINSRSDAAGFAGTGKFSVDGDNALLNSDLVLTSSQYEIKNYSIELLEGKAIEILESNRIISEDNHKLISNLSIYLGKTNTSGVSLTLSIDSVLNPTGVLSTVAYATNDVIAVGVAVGEKTTYIDVKIIGSDDSIITTIINTDLTHLTQFIGENDVQLGYNLFLPTNLKKYNATISWFSNKADVMSNDGVLLNEQGYVTLTATIKVNDIVYNQEYLIHVVQQDNLSKLQYLALKIEQEALLEAVGTDAGLDLPIASNYMTWTENKNLGITELMYEVESSYYYISVDSTTTSNSSGILIPGQILSSAKLYLNQITYQKTARIVIRGYFENGETCETYISVRISLSESQISEQIFIDIQNHLDSVNVLQNMLDTRLKNGINNESGDFELLPNVSTATIQYETTNSNFYSIEIDGGIPTLHFKDYTYFSITESSVSITVNIMSSSAENTVAETRTLYFRIPPAITSQNFAALNDIANTSRKNLKNIFYTIKYQALQQADNASDLFYRSTLDILLANISDPSLVMSLQAYILMHDVLNTKELIFEYGSTEIIVDSYDLNVLIELFNWATSTDVKKILEIDELKSYVDTNLHWITSDGQSSLSDGEIELILNYCEKYPAFSLIWSNYIKVLDNTLSDADITSLLETLSSDQIFVKILNWILSPTSATLYEYLAFNDVDKDATIDKYAYSVVEDQQRKRDDTDIDAEILALFQTTIRDSHITADEKKVYAAAYFLKDESFSTTDDYNAAIEAKITLYTDESLLNKDYEDAVSYYAKEELTALTTEERRIFIIDYYYDQVPTETKAENYKKYFLDNITIDGNTSINIPSSLYDILNDASYTVSNKEEQVIVNYVRATKDETVFKDFIEKWNAAYSRTDDIIIIDNANELKEITKVAVIGTYESVVESCYDPVFAAIINWATYHTTTNPSNEDSITLETALANFPSAKAIFITEELAYRNDWLYGTGSFWSSPVGADYVSENEWNIIAKYGKLYGLSSYELFGYDYLNHYRPKNSDVTGTLESKYVVDNSAGTSGGFLATYSTGSCLSTAFLNDLITEINSKYTTTSTGNLSEDVIGYLNDYNTLLEYITSSTYSKIQYLSELTTINNVNYELGDLIIDDTYSTVSWSEYLVIKAYFDTAWSKITSDWTIANITTTDSTGEGVMSPLANIFKEYYFPSGALDMSVADTVQGSKSTILNTIDDTEAFNTIIDKITQLGSSSPSAEDYFDNLSTISKEELEYLVNQYKGVLNFISRLDAAFTAYNISFDGVVTAVTDGVDRVLSSADIVAIQVDLNALLGNEETNLHFNYIPLERVTENDVSCFEVIRYFTSLISISFKGNRFNALFSSSVSANNLFDIVCNSGIGIEELVFNYCLLSDISSVYKLTTLKSLDLKGNNQETNSAQDIYEFNDLSPILLLLFEKKNNNKDGLKYLSIYNTNIKYSQAELFLIQLYEYSSTLTPEYYYNKNGVETLFVYSNENAVARELASLLKEIEEVRTPNLYLTKNVFNSTYTGTVKWNISDGRQYVSINSTNDVLTTTASGMAVITATVTVIVNEVSQEYTRYFIVQVIK